MNTIELVPGTWIKNKKYIDDELRLYDYLIQIICVLRNKVLPFSERSLLTYYTKYGVSKETEDLFVTDFNRTKQIVANLKYSLTKKQFLIKHESLNSWELPDFLKKKRDTLTLILEFTIKNDRTGDV